jgi:D-beta-D-heptose 7-phosphate kinase / D-beta-D-heptose 1-phosphate adenosyltransferase
MEVTVIGGLGDDSAGATVRGLLADGGVDLIEVPYRGATPQKMRLRSRNQALLRLDRGAAPGALGMPGHEGFDAIASADIVVVADYGRGVTAIPEIRDALAAMSGHRPIVWDPHPRGSAPTPGCQLVTPNESEVAGSSAASGHRLAWVARSGQAAATAWSASAVAVTLGADGALLCQQDATPLLTPAPRRVDGDCCGAGDRFATAAGIALASGALASEAVQAAVTAATAFIAEGGVAGVSTDPDAAVDREPPHVGAEQTIMSVRARGGVVVATGGCFDLLHAGHVAMLTAARALGDCLIVCLNSDASVTRLKGPGRPLTPAADRARMLAALSSVDAVVIFDEDTPEQILDRLRPDIWVKGGDYFLAGAGAGPDLPEAETVRRWGGQAVIVPYLSGYSTTGIIDAARTASHANGKEMRP